MLRMGANRRIQPSWYSRLSSGRVSNLSLNAIMALNSISLCNSSLLHRKCQCLIAFKPLVECSPTRPLSRQRSTSLMTSFTTPNLITLRSQWLQRVDLHQGSKQSSFKRRNSHLWSTMYSQYKVTLNLSLTLC
jgi:hypothetical protein